MSLSLQVLWADDGILVEVDYFEQALLTESVLARRNCPWLVVMIVPDVEAN